jgi:hypothetical protein
MCDRGRGASLVKHGERRMLIKQFEPKERHIWGGKMRLKLYIKMIRKYVIISQMKVVIRDI